MHDLTRHLNEMSLAQLERIHNAIREAQGAASKPANRERIARLARRVQRALNRVYARI